MKNLGLLSVIISALLLTACMNSTAVHIVEDMYQAALIENKEAVEAYFADEFMKEHEPFEEFVSGLTKDVRKMEGVKLMHLTELRENDLKDHVVSKLEDKFSEPWNLVVAQTDAEQVTTWIVSKGANQYYIVDGETYHIDEYNNDILK